MDRRKTHAGRLSHVDGTLLRQVHMVEVDELKLGLFLWPETDKKRRYIEDYIHEHSVYFFWVLGRNLNLGFWVTITILLII